jgi:hypothetical protein
VENIEGIDEPTPVKGWLDRIDKDGKPEHIDFSPDELEQITKRFTDDDLVNVMVEFSDGTTFRPFRFCETQTHFKEVVDNETGTSTLVF